MSKYQKIARPNLFVIGAMKSGTSSLHAYLSEHPEIFMCTPKEPCYFVNPDQLRKDWPKMWLSGYWKSEDRYLELFAHAKNAKIIGESSTSYTKLPRINGVAERIRSFNPNAKFIYLMRDPVKRAISHYWHAVRNDGETRSLNRALRNDRHFIDVSDYAAQLAPYFRIFGREKILTVTFERLVANPANVMREIFAWLNVDPGILVNNLKNKENVTPKTVRQFRLWGITEKFCQFGIWNLIAPMVPNKVRAIARRTFSERFITRTDVDLDCAEKFLREELSSRVVILSEMLNRKFDEWRTLNLKA